MNAVVMLFINDLVEQVYDFFYKVLSPQIAIIISWEK